MSNIAIEEMQHFKMVHLLMVKRGMVLGREQKNDYAVQLQKFFPKTKDRTDALIQRLLVAALIVERSFSSAMYFKRNSVLTTRPNSRKAKYSLFFLLAVPSLFRIVDGVIFPAFMDKTIRSISGKCVSIKSH